MKKITAVLLSVVMMFACFTAAFAAVDGDMPFDNSAFFTDGEYTLHYRTYEPAVQEKNRIMLLHGFGLSTASFEGLAEQYAAEGYKVVLVDLPNFGYSSRETISMQLVDREVLVSDLMKELGGTWIIGGHSMGGGVAANVAIDNPDIVTGVVLFAPQTSAEMSDFAAKIVRCSAVRTMFECVIRIASRMPSIMRSMVEMSFSDKEYAANYDLDRISDPLKISGTGAGIAIMSSHARATDADKFGELTVPIVIVTCKNDKVAAADNIAALVDSAPAKLTTYEFENGGHMMMEYDPVLAAQVTLGTIAACA